MNSSASKKRCTSKLMLQSRVRVAYSYYCNLTWRKAFALCQSLRQQWDEILESIGPCSEHDHTDVEPRHVLLARKVLVSGEEDFVFLFGQSQQCTIFQAGPPAVKHRIRIDTRHVFR